MTTPPLHSLSLHANHLSRNVNNERMQAILQWVGVGSVIMMGAAATVGMFKDVFKSGKPEYRELRERLDRHYESQERGR